MYHCGTPPQPPMKSGESWLCVAEKREPDGAIRRSAPRTSPGSRPCADAAAAKASAAARTNSRTCVRVMIPSQGERSYTPNGLVDGGKSDRSSGRIRDADHPRGSRSTELSIELDRE